MGKMFILTDILGPYGTIAGLAVGLVMTIFGHNK
jgi:hypothetical protein